MANGAIAVNCADTVFAAAVGTLSVGVGVAALPDLGRLHAFKAMADKAVISSRARNLSMFSSFHNEAGRRSPASISTRVNPEQHGYFNPNSSKNGTYPEREG